MAASQLPLRCIKWKIWRLSKESKACLIQRIMSKTAKLKTGTCSDWNKMTKKLITKHKLSRLLKERRQKNKFVKMRWSFSHGKASVFFERIVQRLTWLLKITSTWWLYWMYSIITSSNLIMTAIWAYTSVLNSRWS